MSNIDVVTSLVKEMDVGDVSAFTALFMYQGFNPEMVFAHLAKVKESKNLSNETFLTDIKTLMVIGAVMGNYNETNSKKISEEGKTKGDSLMVKYELKKGKIGMDKRAVNIPRIMAAFPVISTRITIKCSPRNYGGAFGADQLPNCMKTSVFPSLIPRNLPSLISKSLLLASCCYTSEQTMTITRGKEGADPALIFQEQIKYTDVSFKSSVPSSNERAAAMKEFEFKYEGLIAVLKKYTEITKDAISVPDMATFQNSGIRVI